MITHWGEVLARAELVDHLSTYEGVSFYQHYQGQGKVISPTYCKGLQLQLKYLESKNITNIFKVDRNIWILPKELKTPVIQSHKNILKDLKE